MKIISIDIGIFNLGMIMVEVDHNYNIVDWTLIEKVNIQHLCLFCRNPECNLPHEKTFSDYINHFIHKYHSSFKQCDTIILERQPPLGFIVIQELILDKFRNKTILISPRSVHKFHNITKYDYEERKVLSVNITKDVMKEDFIKVTKYQRQHDIADAVCQLLYWLNLKQSLTKQSLTKQSLTKPFQDFMYNPIITDFSLYNYKST